MKALRNTKIAKQNRIRVKFHRDFNKILIKDSIRNTTQTNSLVHRQSSNTSQGQFEKRQLSEERQLSGREQIRRWALKYNISKCAVSALLKVLISIGLNWLPKDSRSLFQTQRYVELTTLSNGKIWYQGVNQNLDMIFANLKTNMKISLCLNMDGLPLFNSSKYQFWPILARVFGKISLASLMMFFFKQQLFMSYSYETYILEYPQIRPFVIAIWCGEGKPSCNEFLQKFVDEMKELTRNGGAIINDFVLETRIKMIINDTPARSYVKGVLF